MRDRTIVPVFTVVAFCLSACGRTLTIEECGTDLSCSNSVVNRDTVTNGVGSGIIASALGAGAGFAFGGPKGALRGAIIGLSTGAIAGAAVTYYVEHQEVSALVDLQLKIDIYKKLLDSYKIAIKEQSDRSIRLEEAVKKSNSDINVVRETLNDYQNLLSKTEGEISDLKNLVENSYIGVKSYNSAVKTKYNGMPSDILTDEKHLLSTINDLKEKVSDLENQRGNFINKIQALREIVAHNMT